MEKENKAHTTVQHEVVQAWSEERGGKPARVKGSKEKKKGGILRIDFGTKEEELEPVSWPEFFKVFDEHRLAFLFQEETANGKTSLFCKLVRRKP